MTGVFGGLGGFELTGLGLLGHEMLKLGMWPMRPRLGLEACSSSLLMIEIDAVVSTEFRGVMAFFSSSNLDLRKS